MTSSFDIAMKHFCVRQTDKEFGTRTEIKCWLFFYSNLNVLKNITGVPLMTKTLDNESEMKSTSWKTARFLSNQLPGNHIYFYQMKLVWNNWKQLLSRVASPRKTMESRNIKSASYIAILLCFSRRVSLFDSERENTSFFWRFCSIIFLKIFQIWFSFLTAVDQSVAQNWFGVGYCRGWTWLWKFADISLNSNVLLVICIKTVLELGRIIKLMDFYDDFCVFLWIFVNFLVNFCGFSWIS